MFDVVLATWRSATEGWVVTRRAILEITGGSPAGGRGVDRLGLPLGLYAGPDEAGRVEHGPDRLSIELPDARPGALGRLAAVLLLVAGDPALPAPRVPPAGRTWRGLGTAGRHARLPHGASAQRAALSLLDAMESSGRLILDRAGLEALREEWTGASALPVDATADAVAAPPSTAPCPGVIASCVADPAVSIVLAAHGEAHRVHLTIEAVRATTPEPYEAIVVDDGSTDGCCDFLRSSAPDHPEVTLVTQERQGSSVARNTGVTHARAPIVVFMDAHCFPRPGWLEALLAVLDDPSVGIATPAISVAGNPSNKGYGLTIAGPQLSARWLDQQGEAPCRVPAAGAGCLAMRRDDFVRIGQFEPMRRYGLEDVELSIRCWLAGLDVVCEPRAHVGHWFKDRPNFEIPWTDYLYNILRTAILHFDGDDLGAVVEAAARDGAFATASSLLLTSDIWTRRADVRSRSVRDGRWYLDRFGLTLRG